MRIFYRVNTANGMVDLTEDVSGGLAAHKSRIEGIYGDKLVRFGVMNPEGNGSGSGNGGRPSGLGGYSGGSNGSVISGSGGAADPTLIIFGLVFGLFAIVYCFFSWVFDTDKGQVLKTDLRIAGDLRERCSDCSFCDSDFCHLYDLELVAPGESVCSSYN